MFPPAATEGSSRYAMASKEETKSLRTSFTKTLQRIPGAAFLFAVVPLVVLGYLGWFYYGAEHLDHALYSLAKENLSVTEQPSWIESDIVDEVYSRFRLDQISLLDPGANAAIAQAFETHGWVKKATRVTKSAGGTVNVDLVYRRPMAMVYTDDGTEKGFWAIDNEGVILPTKDFNQNQVYDYFQIFAPEARQKKEGMSFGDARIEEALKLCAYLSADREALGLQEIWIDQEPTRSNGPSSWIMTILSKSKQQVMIWGHAPGVEAHGESTADEKKNRMAAWLARARVKDGVQKTDLRKAAEPTSPVSVH